MDNKSPVVVHLKRSGGQVVQDCDVYIGRACNMGGWHLQQSDWANPFPTSKFTREEAVKKYRAWLLTRPDLIARLPELAGKRLGCWCKPLACHGDAIVEIYDSLYTSKVSPMSVSQTTAARIGN
jgi:hypothetical protein